MSLKLRKLETDEDQRFFYSPTDTQVNCLKNLKFTLKLALKQLRHF